MAQIYIPNNTQEFPFLHILAKICLSDDIYSNGCEVIYCSVTQLYQTLCYPMDCSMPGFPVFHLSWSLLKLMSIESMMPSNHLILCRLLSLLPSVFSSIRVFSSESALHIRWPKYWVSASTSVLPVNTQDWSPLGWTGWISLQSKGLSRVFSNTIVQKHQFFSAQLSL